MGWGGLRGSLCLYAQYEISNVNDCNLIYQMMLFPAEKMMQSGKILNIPPETRKIKMISSFFSAGNPSPTESIENFNLTTIGFEWVFISQTVLFAANFASIRPIENIFKKWPKSIYFEQKTLRTSPFTNFVPYVTHQMRCNWRQKDYFHIEQTVSNWIYGVQFNF